jgi:exonuclease VII large subunit
MARRRAGYEMDQQAQAYESQLQHSQQKHIEPQQKHIEALQRQPTQHYPQPQQQHEDLTEKLKKYADLKTARNFNRRIPEAQSGLVF